MGPLLKSSGALALPLQKWKHINLGDIVEYAGPFVVLFFFYALTGHLALDFYTTNKFASFIWPPTGIALAIILLKGYRYWPAVTLAAFVVNFSAGAPLVIALGIAAGNTLEIVAGAFAINRLATFDPQFSTLRNNVVFIVFAAIIATTLSATIGVASLIAGNVIPMTAFTPTWIAWWTGNMFGALVITPLITTWYTRPPLSFDLRVTAEILAYTAVFLAINVTIFIDPLSILPDDAPLRHFSMLPLIWAALRFRARGLTLSIIVMGMISIYGAITGSYQPFENADLNRAIFYVQMFTVNVAVLYLIFLSVVEERRRAIKALLEHIETIERDRRSIRSSDKAKSDFLAILAHELRNPLAPVMSAVETLRTRTVSGAEHTRVLEMIQEQINTIVRLLDDLMDITRISRRKISLKRETTSLNEVVERSVKATQDIVKKRNHALSVSPSDRDILIHADPVRLEQVIVNLLNNAAKYTNPGGKIDLSYAEENGRAVIRVKDTGQGIEEDVMEKIFDPFFQGHGSEEGQSLGIGLSITKSLVELHGGTISAKSEGREKGSEFIVELPVPDHINVPLPLQEKNGSVIDSQTPTKFKILLVDDNKAAADSLGALLRHFGHDVRITYDGESALSECRRFEPKVAILDIGLPDISGYSLGRRLKALGTNPPVLIALTGYGFEDDKIKSQEAGFSFHLTKPASVEDIEGILRRLPTQ